MAHATFCFTAVLALALGACTIQTRGLGNDPPPPGGEPAPAPATATASATGAGVTSVETITDDTGRQYQIQQGQKGDPTVIGCADGQREAFVDGAAYPNIAGCLASWTGKLSLRAPRAGAACGDDNGAGCASPADACAPGWHVCGADGHTADIKQVSGAQCEQAGGGRFSAALSHCMLQQDCNYDMAPNAMYPCFADGWCSEPVCCGGDCGDFGACRDGIWPGQTHIPVGTDQGCAAASSARAGGLLCCKG